MDPAEGGSLASLLAQYSRHGSSISDPHALSSKVIHWFALQFGSFQIGSHGMDVGFVAHFSPM
jgi:hypothetical protein